MYLLQSEQYRNVVVSRNYKRTIEAVSDGTPAATPRAAP